jgi:hypothetical protein
MRKAELSESSSRLFRFVMIAEYDAETAQKQHTRYAAHDLFRRGFVDNPGLYAIYRQSVDADCNFLWVVTR